MLKLNTKMLELNNINMANIKIYGSTKVFNWIDHANPTLVNNLISFEFLKVECSAIIPTKL